MNVYDKKQKFLDAEIGRGDKEKILEYVKGNSILEIGCGSGVNLDMISDKYPEKLVTGMDISDKVIRTLELRKDIENRKWNVIQGNATNIDQYVAKDSVNTIIFCSVIHELFSYIEWHGRKFNYETIEYILSESFKLLPAGGRIIIRDGVMAQVDSLRHIVFKTKAGINFFHKYVEDFKGRTIKYRFDGPKDVCLLLNDAMEFLYTYTWGYKPYACEVQEQYGYLSEPGYIGLVKRLFGDKAEVIHSESYLQGGYAKALKNKVEFFDEFYNKAELPDSNLILVIEKVNQQSWIR
jgi:SAM-dependent methyltransferase